jgi:uncharacterized protein CbrC (UPF0167 family)
MNDLAKQVMARLTDKGIICPDCHKVCDHVLVEKFDHRLFKMDMKNKLIIEDPGYHNWETNDWAYHCPHCDSLNIDSEIRELGIKIGVPGFWN